MHDFIHSYHSPLGEMLAASDGTHLIGLWFEDSRYYGNTLQKEIVKEDALPVFLGLDAWLDSYFAKEQPKMSLPLLVRGTDFERTVCSCLLSIPYGKTISYGALAELIANQRGAAHLSARAVGTAVGKNPISILIPCHRVIGKDGALHGYSGGLWRKKALLDLEKEAS